MVVMTRVEEQLLEHRRQHAIQGTIVEQEQGQEERGEDKHK